ncbi:MAG TPA: class I tRNA ligase family protein, partial [Chloroflexota bacterium]|nr:class I tRNA ligase family protein [Chloroflexota bacterium]
PFLPHITEAIYTQGFSATDGAASVHVARWPVAPESWTSPEADTAGEAILAVADGARRWKAERKLSVGVPVSVITVSAPSSVLPALEASVVDLKSVTRAQEVRFAPGGDEVTLEIEASQAQSVQPAT